ncbi:MULTISPECIES: DUF2382 domain-containing protein [Ramlibacter]|uniref:DUF2382 domain-containing protein n=1 Tax=Ramlibacter aquaticus TaxID=2780094 RepID=A0ABR9SFV7_9BURK|nr:MULTISPECIES: DUF2382 domain-containing protein [Ramlibacter]MBE7941233.1 DUF2382 domain-containing protein [Ramlibacter aquaticus]
MAEPTPAPGSLTLPVTEEELLVGRRRVDTQHTLRVRKEVQAEPVEWQGETTVETVHVERVPVGRVVDRVPEVREDGEVTVIPVVEERLVVTRELVLVEELRLLRRREQRPAVARTTLRRERVVVERQDPATGQWAPEDGH